MTQTTGAMILRLLTLVGVAVTAIFLYVLLFVEPCAHIPPYSAPPVQVRPPLVVQPGDAEKYGFRHGDADVPEAYKVEFRSSAR